MTLSYRQGNQPIINIQDSFVEVQPRDDLTLATWRFERRKIGLILEFSYAWREFGGVANVLDPFQMASDQYEIHWVKPLPEKELIVATKEKEFSVLIDVPRKSILIISQIEDDLAYNDIMIQLDDKPGIHVISNPERVITIEQIDIHNVRITVDIPSDKNVETNIKLDKYPFEPRMMNLPLQEKITAGDKLSVKKYIWNNQNS